MGYFSLTRLGVQTCRVTSFDDQLLYSKQWFGVVESYLYTNFVSKNEILSFQVLKSNFLIGYFLFKSSEKFVKSLHLPFHIMKVNMTWIWVSTSPPPPCLSLLCLVSCYPHLLFGGRGSPYPLTLEQNAQFTWNLLPRSVAIKTFKKC